MSVWADRLNKKITQSRANIHRTGKWTPVAFRFQFQDKQPSTAGWAGLTARLAGSHKASDDDNFIYFLPAASFLHFRFSPRAWLPLFLLETVDILQDKICCAFSPLRLIILALFHRSSHADGAGGGRKIVNKVQLADVSWWQTTTKRKQREMR